MDDIEIIYSPLCGEVTVDGKTIQVHIYDDGEGRWILEADDEYGNSSLWDEHFESDQKALEALHKAIAEDGIDSLVGPPSGSSDVTKLEMALTNDEIDELDAFLLSDATSDEVMSLDMMDGYLTAIASGPVTMPPSLWLPPIWGPTPEDAPEFANDEEARRIILLIMRHMNSIITSLQNEPDEFEPLFDFHSYGDDPREYMDGEMWAYGYLTGIELQREEWSEFFRHPDSGAVLRPITLLGADDLSPEDWALSETPEQREKLSEEILESITWIYNFWEPYRQAMMERLVATTYQREHPKIGRNDPCPCGSGKKFKKCCGVGQQLH